MRRRWVNLDRREARELTNHGNNGDTPAVLAVVLEPYLAIDLGVQGVVFAQANVEAGFESPALLAYEDRPAGDDVSVVAFDTKPLRIAVTAVA